MSDAEPKALEVLESALPVVEDDSVATEIRSKATDRVDAAYDAIDAVLRSRKSSAAVKLNAAKDILDRAGGRSETRTATQQKGGLSVVILNLSGNTPAEKIVKAVTGVDRGDMLANFAESVDDD